MNCLSNIVRIVFSYFTIVRSAILSRHVIRVQSSKSFFRVSIAVLLTLYHIRFLLWIEFPLIWTLSVIIEKKKREKLITFNGNRDLHRELSILKVTVQRHISPVLIRERKKVERSCSPVIFFFFKSSKARFERSIRSSFYP